MDYLGRWSSWADLPPPLQPPNPPQATRFQAALIPLSLHSPMDPKTSPRSFKAWRASSQAVSWNPRLKDRSWAFRCLPETPFITLLVGLFQKSGAEEDCLSLASEGALIVQAWLLQVCRGWALCFRRPRHWHGGCNGNIYWGGMEDWFLCPSHFLPSLINAQDFAFCSSCPYPGSHQDQTELPAPPKPFYLIRHFLDSSKPSKSYAIQSFWRSIFYKKVILESLKSLYMGVYYACSSKTDQNLYI